MTDEIKPFVATGEHSPSPCQHCYGTGYIYIDMYIFDPEIETTEAKQSRLLCGTCAKQKGLIKTKKSRKVKA
jgi:hypothetical protein